MKVSMNKLMIPSLLVAALAPIACGPKARPSQHVAVGSTKPGQAPTDSPANGEGADAKTATSTPAVSKSVSPSAVDTTIPAGPTTLSYKIANGSLSFDLGSARPALAGAQVTAQVIVNAGATGVLPSVTLQQMAVTAPAGTGLMLYRPVIVTEKPGEAEKLFVIGATINQKVEKGRQVPLAVESINMSGLEAGQSIKLRFSALEVQADAVNTGIPNYRECKVPANFSAMATALTPCKSCHGGLFNYDFIGKDLATACGQNLKLIDASLTTSGKVPNLQRPLTAGHPATSTTGYSQALSTWRGGEGL